MTQKFAKMIDMNRNYGKPEKEKKKFGKRFPVSLPYR